MAAGSVNQWTFDEKKVFEDAMAAKPELFMRGEWHEIAKLIPTKTTEEIKAHYENRKEDAKMTESSAYPGDQYTQELKEDIRKILDGSLQPPLLLQPPKEEGLEEALREIGYEYKKAT